jgi:hypothetical protein
MTWVDQMLHHNKIAEIRDLEWHALQWLTFNMRDIDRREVFNDQPATTALEVTAVIMHETARCGLGYMAYINGRPASAFGVFKMWDGVFQVWSFGTDEYTSTLVSFRQKWSETVAWLLEQGCHRLHCASLVDHVESRRFLQLLGARCESTLKGYGKDGSDYLMYVWDKEALQDVLRRQQIDTSAGTSAAATVQDG